MLSEEPVGPASRADRLFRDGRRGADLRAVGRALSHDLFRGPHRLRRSSRPWRSRRARPGISTRPGQRVARQVGAHGVIAAPRRRDGADARPAGAAEAGHHDRPDPSQHARRDPRLVRWRCLRSGNRLLRVLGPSPAGSGETVEVLLDEAPLRREMWDFGVRILELSIVLSLVTAALVYLSLQWLLVRPMRRITASMIAVPRGSRGRLADDRARAGARTRSASPSASWR